MFPFSPGAPFGQRGIAESAAEHPVTTAKAIRAIRKSGMRHLAAYWNIERRDKIEWAARRSNVMRYTRRDLGKFALAALPASLLAKPDSKFGGVQIGINVPYSFHGMPGDADSVQKDVIKLGLSAVELRSQPVEAFFGCPISYNTDRKSTRLNSSHLGSSY